MHTKASKWAEKMKYIMKRNRWMVENPAFAQIHWCDLIWNPTGGVDEEVFELIWSGCGGTPVKKNGAAHTQLGSVWTGQHGLHKKSVSFFCNSPALKLHFGHPDWATFSTRRAFSPLPSFPEVSSPSTSLPPCFPKPVCSIHWQRAMSYMR